MPRNFKQALSIVSNDPSLSDADRDHLRRWEESEYVNNPIWKRLAAAGDARSLLPRGTSYETLIRESLYVRGYAESVASGINPHLRERQAARQRHLELAQKAEDLADYYRDVSKYSGIADYFERFLRPVGELEELHRREASVLRERGRRQPTSAARVSRQDRSSNAPSGLRKIKAFIDLMNSTLTFWFSETPDYEAISLLLEVAFPTAVLDSEDIRQALRPTTRAGRSARALKRKES